MAKISYLKLCTRFVVRGPFNFSNHYKTSVVEDNVNATESCFGFGKRSFDLVWLGNIKLDDKQLVSRVAGLEIDDCIRCAKSCYDLVPVLEQRLSRGSSKSGGCAS